MVGCGCPTTATFGNKKVVWAYRSPIAEFALLLCEEIDRRHVDAGYCVIVGQGGPKITALSNDGVSWHILAGKVRTCADRLVPAHAGGFPSQRG
jgi:hypothetical protein